MRNIRIGVVEDDPASCQLVLDYLNRYQQEMASNLPFPYSTTAHES